MDGPVGAIANWVVEVVATLGYLGVGALVALENVFPPIPSELVLPMAGFLAGQGRLSLAWVVVAATIGSVVGALVLYGIGRWVGDERLREFVRGPGRYLLLQESDMDRAEEWFDRHGGLAVFLGRLVPMVRSGISIPAGIQEMPILRFVLYTTAGSGIWNAALVGAGYWLGSQWQWAREYAQYFQWVVLAAIVAAIGWFVWKRLNGQPEHAS